MKTTHYQSYYYNYCDNKISISTTDLRKQCRQRSSSWFQTLTWKILPTLGFKAFVFFCIHTWRTLFNISFCWPAIDAPAAWIRLNASSAGWSQGLLSRPNLSRVSREHLATLGKTHPLPKSFGWVASPFYVWLFSVKSILGEGLQSRLGFGNGYFLFYGDAMAMSPCSITMRCQFFWTFLTIAISAIVFAEQ